MPFVNNKDLRKVDVSNIKVVKGQIVAPTDTSKREEKVVKLKTNITFPGGESASLYLPEDYDNCSYTRKELIDYSSNYELSLLNQEANTKIEYMNGTRPIAPTDTPKRDDGKYKAHLVNKEIIEAIARVREFGVAKYGGEHGWKMMTEVDYLDAMLRHADACRSDINSRDKESGILHLAHVACNIMFLLVMMTERGETITDRNFNTICSALKERV